MSAPIDHGKTVLTCPERGEHSSHDQPPHRRHRQPDEAGCQPPVSIRQLLLTELLPAHTLVRDQVWPDWLSSPAVATGSCGEFTVQRNRSSLARRLTPNASQAGLLAQSDRHAHRT